MITALVVGIEDFGRGLASWRIWYLAGSASLRKRFSRTLVGQLWLTLSNAMFLIPYGLLFSLVFNAPVQETLPYIAVSLTLWRYMSGIVTGSTNCLLSDANYFKNQPLPYSIPILSRIYQDSVVLIYEGVVVIAILFYFGKMFEIKVFEFLLVVFLFLFSAVWVGYLLAIVCTRFRDMSQFIASLVRAAFLLTPIIWSVEMIPEEYQLWLFLNPFTVAIILMRGPLLGESFETSLFLVTAATSLLGFVVTLTILGNIRHRIIFWM